MIARKFSRATYHGIRIILMRTPTYRHIATKSQYSLDNFSIVSCNTLAVYPGRWRM
jgi:hypothetical protein